MSQASRRHAVEAAHQLHRRAEAVSAPLFGGGGFFQAFDKVQVKYEMVRAHEVDGMAASTAARLHGFSRAGFYVVAEQFDRAGMVGLLDGRRGPHGPYKLSPEILAFLAAAPATASGAELAEQVARLFGVRLHRRTVERARHRG